MKPDKLFLNLPPKNVIKDKIPKIVMIQTKTFTIFSTFFSVCSDETSVFNLKNFEKIVKER